MTTFLHAAVVIGLLLLLSSVRARPAISSKSMDSHCAATTRSRTSRSNSPTHGDARAQLRVPEVRSSCSPRPPTTRSFAANPEKYAPQFGGFCALGTANGYKVSTEPDAFKVVDGKLYLNYDRKVLDLWSKDQAGYIAKANVNWPEVAKQPRKD